MGRASEIVKLSVNSVMVQDDEEFETRFSKRLLSILYGGVPFSIACSKLLLEIMRDKEKEGNEPTTNQTVVFLKPKKYKSCEVTRRS